MEDPKKSREFPQMLYGEGGHRIVHNAEDREKLLKQGYSVKPLPAAAPEVEASIEDRLAALEERVDALEAKKKK